MNQSCNPDPESNPANEPRIYHNPDNSDEYDNQCDELPPKMQEVLDCIDRCIGHIDNMQTIIKNL